jgi:hypothetical protein
MEFGIFSQMHVPPWDDEHSRYLRELEVAQAAEAAGFKYDWSPEHHFLEHYSHQPAPEVFLSCVAARTKRIHVGTAITNITAPVNHKRCKQPVGAHINDNIAVTTAMFCLEDGDEARQLFANAKVERCVEYFFKLYALS